jgi:hypothetical protein
MERWENELGALHNQKESHPIQVAEYAVANKIANVLHKHDHMICAYNTRYFKRTHMFGIEIPKSVEEALEIDRKTGTDFWLKAILKELKNVDCAFEFLKLGETIPVRFKWIPMHMIFVVKMDFTCKAHLVAGDHVTNPSTNITYSSVVSRNSV